MRESRFIVDEWLDSPKRYQQHRKRRVEHNTNSFDSPTDQPVRTKRRHLSRARADEMIPSTVPQHNNNPMTVQANHVQLERLVGEGKAQIIERAEGLEVSRPLLVDEAVETDDTLEFSTRASRAAHDMVDWERILEEEVKRELHERALALTAEREKITVLRAPIQALSIVAFLLKGAFRRCVVFVCERLFGATIVASCIAIVSVLHITEGNHSSSLKWVESFLQYHFYWVLLGVLSSVGLGTGLHTFVLYLGPHIALYTIQITACNSMDVKPQGYELWSKYNYFGKPDFSCDGPSESEAIVDMPEIRGFSMSAILANVWFSAFLWGLGTSLGELPPYFLASAARAAGKQVDELDDVILGMGHHGSDGDEVERPQKSLSLRIKLWTMGMLKKHGLATIVLFASIPNPLFDLAGLLCGHLGVPFWTFFGATFIGKACIKSGMQTLAVIGAVGYIDNIIAIFDDYFPSFSRMLKNGLSEWRQELQTGNKSLKEKSLLSVYLGRAWDVILFLMIAYFILSIIDSFVQRHLAEEEEKKMERLKTELLAAKRNERRYYLKENGCSLR